MSPDRPSPAELAAANDLRRRAWNKEARGYDKRIGFFERRVFGAEHRAWACSQAIGKTLEVAIGTALNLPHYPAEVELLGLDLSAEMLAIARKRAAELGRDIELREGDAHNLPFSDATLDTVVCTYSLCNIPDEALAISEMKRVLRPGGRLILVDHIRSSKRPVLWLQRFIEFFSRRMEGEHMTRRPFAHVEAQGFTIVRRDRMRAGVIERLVALKPT